MKTLILAAVLVLSGCANMGNFKNTEVLVQKEYIVRTAPDTLKALPPLPADLKDPNTASNSEVASWINDTEEYAANLESIIKNLIQFYEKPVTEQEKTK